MSKKTKSQQFKDDLFYKNESCTTVLSADEIAQADTFCEGYKKFLNDCKTEREVVSFARSLAEENGFVPFNKNVKYAPGDRVYHVNRNKAVILAVMGKKSVANGVNITASHIDSPRIDLKPCPLYEDNSLAFFKTHYYGGIKKYQWTALPLSLHGVIVKGNGEKVEINIGEDDNDPCFVITDLLPHLSKEQNKRNLSEAIKGEELNVLIGSRDFKDEDEKGDMVKLNIIKILNEKYGITEKDFLSSELTLVPAVKVKDIGFDRSLIGGYGHDDRVCSYPALMSVLDCEIPEHTAIAVLADKEEVGSDGNTGLNSSYLRYFIADLARMEGLMDRDVLSNSRCLSADVNAAFDPTYPNVMEKMNSAYINKGIVVTKYTGSRGKSGTSDASAEFVGEVRRIFDDAGVVWQLGELGKVDEGGGGTVAMYIANMDVDVIDVGVPVLSMHAPYEVVSKLDVYMAYKAFAAFFRS